MGKGESAESSSDEGDIEKQSDATKRTPTTAAEKGQKLHFCKVCLLDTPATTYHCDDCEVCIDDYDHHCVFFSKCIGGGNIYPFWGSMAGLGVNFIIVICILISTGLAERPSVGKQSSPPAN